MYFSLISSFTHLIQLTMPAKGVKIVIFREDGNNHVSGIVGLTKKMYFLIEAAEHQQRKLTAVLTVYMI
uniref:Uncharacterized protein n=1 Tax=Octopus bimaculoides TaxID=37653 RepID=A0A0L8HSA1_OCTBM